MTGPNLDALMRRLSECPADFLAEPRVGDVYHQGPGERLKRRGSTGVLHVDALVGDLAVRLGRRQVRPSELAVFCEADRSPTSTGALNWLRVVAVSVWLAWDDGFVGRTKAGEPIGDVVLEFLRTGLVDVAKLVKAESFVTDPDRREELVRLLLNAMGQHPAGETAEHARDRLDTVSTVARESVVRRMRAQQERARKLREEMERQRAQEAAARYSRE